MSSSVGASTVPSRMLAHYEVKELIGSGGSGDVYLAHDHRLCRDVAIKILRNQSSRDDSRDRLRHEALTISQLNHPGIAAVYDYDSAEGQDFLVTEYVPGRTLKDVIANDRLAENAVVKLALQAVDAIAEAHKNGIVHRDVKPANIRVTNDGRVKVLDFGLAGIRRRLDDETVSEPVIATTGGTLHYMAPEALTGGIVDERSDLYSIGVVLYELATAQLPFDHSVVPALVEAILHERPLPPSYWRPELSSRFEDVILRCLEKDPEHRYQTAVDLAADLRRVAEADLHRQRSIVVLYFENIGSEQDAYFRDGMTEDITTELARIRELHIFPRSAVVAFRDKAVTPAFVGQKLGASYVLEGSIRRDGERFRVSASLVETHSGLTVWAERYDREVRDVFAIQEDIARNIATALQIALTEREARAIRATTTSSVRAYDFYLRGRQFFHQFRRRGYVLAREMFEKAIEADPHYARAYAGIADCFSFEYMYWDSKREFLEGADKASRQALELGPNLAEAHASRGLNASLAKRYDEAQREFETAMRLDPRLFEAYYFYARAMYSQGKLEAAARWFEQASRVTADDYQALIFLGSALSGLGRTSEAVAAYRRGVLAAEKHLEQHPEDGRALYFGANGLTQIGDKERARRWVERAVNLEPDEPLVVYNVACVYALLGDSDAALNCLERSITKGWGQKEWMRNDPDLQSIRGDPRFQLLITQ